MSRAFRRFVAKLAIALLLFMQLAVAAYACPGLVGNRQSFQSMEDSAMEMDGGECATPDRSVPNLCRQHCQYDSQASGQSSSPVSFPPDLPVLTFAPVVVSLVPVSFDALPELLARTTAPPLFIRFRVFRS